MYKYRPDSTNIGQTVRISAKWYEYQPNNTNTGQTVRSQTVRIPAIPPKNERVRGVLGKCPGRGPAEGGRERVTKSDQKMYEIVTQAVFGDQFLDTIASGWTPGGEIIISAKSFKLITNFNIKIVTKAIKMRPWGCHGTPFGNELDPKAPIWGSWGSLCERAHAKSPCQGHGIIYISKNSWFNKITGIKPYRLA